MNKAKYLNDVISSYGVDSIVQNLKPLVIEEYGSTNMLQKYSLLERLNMQAYKNSLLGGDDFVMNAFVLEDKVKELISDLFICNQFKVKVYPIIKEDIIKISSLKVYICLYFESIIINLLEKFFYYVTACQSADNLLIDIIELCYLRITSTLLSNTIKEKVINNTIDKEKSIDDLDSKYENMNFSVAMSCVSIIRYITDHLEALPFPITNHMLNSKDLPMVLVELIDFRPWESIDNKEKEIAYIFNDNAWVSVKENKSLLNTLNKYEAQVWISIYNLFLIQGKKYEVNDFRKNVLLKLKKYMNQKLYDSLPPLINLYRSLEELNLSGSLGTVLTSSKSFIVELIPELFLRVYGNKSKINYSIIAEEILNKSFKKANISEDMKIVSEAYSTDNLDYFMNTPSCANCGKEATSRCSQCKTEWYCSKECQILRWKSGHKDFCVKMKDLQNEIKNPSNN